MRTSNLMADFSYAERTTLSLLYNSYCMNVYGSQLWRLNIVERFYVGCGRSPDFDVTFAYLNFRLKGFLVSDFQHGDGYTESQRLVGITC